jgi:hypothetical protein
MSERRYRVWLALWTTQPSYCGCSNDDVYEAFGNRADAGAERHNMGRINPSAPALVISAVVDESALPDLCLSPKECEEVPEELVPRPRVPTPGPPDCQCGCGGEWHG